MSIRVAKTVWGFDPKWVRIELFDAHDQPLGIVRFEPNRACSPEELSQTCRRSVHRYGSLRQAAAGLVALLTSERIPSST